MAIADELVAILGYDIEGEGNLRRFNNSLDRLQERGRAVAATMTQWAVVASSAAAAATGWLGKSILDTNAQFEGFQVALETITGSAEQAEQSMDWISDFARKTPYEVAGLTDAFIKLKSYGIDPIANDTLEILGDTASAMNKPLEAAVEALADAATFQFERLREFGVTASQEGDKVTFRYNKNGEEITKTVQKTGDAVRKFLLDNFGDRFGGAMEDQSKTFTGILSNLKEGWTDFQRAIGNAGFFDEAKRRLQNLLDTLGTLDDDGTLDRWAQQLSDFYIGVMDFGQGAFERLRQHFNTLREIFQDPDWQGILQPLAIAFAALAYWLAPVLTTFGALILVLDDFLTWQAGGDSVIGQLIEWFREWTGLVNENGPEATENLNSMGDATAYLARVMGDLLESLQGIKEFFNADLSWAERMNAYFGGISGMARSFLPEGGRLGGAADAMQDFGDNFRERTLGIENPAPTGGQQNRGSLDIHRNLDEIRNLQRQTIENLEGSPSAQQSVRDMSLSEFYQSMEEVRGRQSEPLKMTVEPSGQVQGAINALNNFAANQQRMGQAGEMVMEDHSQDNRQYPVTVNSNVTQNVSTVQQATSEGIRRSGEAIDRATRQRAARINSGSGVTP